MCGKSRKIKKNNDFKKEIYIFFRKLAHNSGASKSLEKLVNFLKPQISNQLIKNNNNNCIKI